MSSEFTARSVALNYETSPGAHPDLAVLGGGGAENLILLERLTVALQRAKPCVQVVPKDEFGWPVGAMEPAAVALLAFFAGGTDRQISRPPRGRDGRFVWAS